MSQSFKALWISDVHLGTPASRAADLLRFLDAVDTETLYLVGDIVDLIAMGGRLQLNSVEQAVVHRFVEIAASGPDVVYIPGNHDYAARDYIDKEVLGVQIRYECEHEMATGERLLVTHGDILDREIRTGTNLEAFGAAAYALLLQLNVAVNKLRSRMGHDYLPVSQRIKSRLASANEYISRYERVAAEHARRNGFDGIVCGHIHKPAAKHIGDTLYLNDGDWVEHRTAIGETADGDIALLHYTSGSVRLERLDRTTPIAA